MKPNPNLLPAALVLLLLIGTLIIMWQVKGHHISQHTPMAALARLQVEDAKNILRLSGHYDGTLGQVERLEAALDRQEQTALELARMFSHKLDRIFIEAVEATNSEQP